jgi:RNA polymerase sigma factor (sigma-70 family)
VDTYTDSDRVMDGHSEHDLIRRARDGDNVAYEDLLRPNLGPAARLARAMLGDAAEAEDVVQEASIRGWRKIANLRSGAQFRPWFLGIVVRQVRTVQRSPWWKLLRLPDPSRGFLVAEDHWLEGEDLRQAISRLPRSQREAVLLHFYLDLPIQEVAAVLGLSVAGVKSRINRALRQLRADIGVAEMGT